MLFTSYSFFGFLAALFLAWLAVPRRWRWPLLLIAGYIFYFASGPENLLYILVTTLTAWGTGLQLQKSTDRQAAWLKEHKAETTKEERQAYKAQETAVRRRWLTACLLLNLAILATVKYGNFFLSNLSGVLQAMGRREPLPLLSLALPMGISFYTFQAIGYLIDVYRGTVRAERSPFRFALFVSYFPLLIQGPISRYGQLSETLYEGRPLAADSFCRGIQRVLWGYFKKLVVADRILPAVLAVTGDAAYGGVYIFVGMVLYTVELYADFTGGIDITIGVSQALGITVAENFNRPYFSKSLKEYWRRWHISMCAWFRDYVFYPVSSSQWMRRFTKFCRKRLPDRVGKRLPVYVASFMVWLATGVWHGANWNFIVWGLANWLVLMVSEELEPLYARFHQRFPGLERSFGWRLFQVGRTFLLVCCLNLFDCYASVGDTLRAFGSMVTVRNWSVLTDGSLLELGLGGADYAVAAAGCLLMLAVSLVQRRGSVRERIAALAWWQRLVLWYGLFIAVLLLGAYGIGYDASQFIYNRF